MCTHLANAGISYAFLDLVDIAREVTELLERRPKDGARRGRHGTTGRTLNAPGPPMSRVVSADSIIAAGPTSTAAGTRVSVALTCETQREHRCMSIVWVVCCLGGPARALRRPSRYLDTPLKTNDQVNRFHGAPLRSISLLGIFILTLRPAGRISPTPIGAVQ